MERAHTAEEGADRTSRLLVPVIGVVAASLIANLYYAQPLIAQIARDIGIGPAFAGTLVSMMQLGYGLGLFLLVPLSDLVENRRLVLGAMAAALVALVAITVVRGAAPFFLACLALGLCCSVAQVLLPFLAHLLPRERRAVVVGNVMAGVLAGVMLARPVSLLVSAAWGWRAVFWCSAGLLLITGSLIAALLPTRRPPGGFAYRDMLSSMAGLFRSHHEVRRRAMYQALMFAAFNMFWAAGPIALAERFHLDLYHIALFALAGAGGALATPFGARLSDRGLVRPGTMGSALTMAIALATTIWAVASGALVAFVVLAVLVDAALQVNQTLGRLVIYGVSAEIRGRVNSIYMCSLFVGGAVGSTMASVTYRWGGWSLTAGLGAALAATVFVFAWRDRPATEGTRIERDHEPHRAGVENR